MTKKKNNGFDGRTGVQHYFGDKPSERFDWDKARRLLEKTLKEVYDEPHLDDG